MTTKELRDMAELQFKQNAITISKMVEDGKLSDGSGGKLFTEYRKFYEQTLKSIDIIEQKEQENE